MYSKWELDTSLLIILIVLYGFQNALARMKNEILDTSYPILIQESTSTDSSSTTYFGFSVSLAQGIRSQPNSPAGWIFIGAPKSNPYEWKYDVDGSDAEPGVIWRCSLGLASSSMDTCEIMKIDPAPRPNTPGNPKLESHSGASIGITTILNHGKLVTCGMRWNRGNKQFYNGICYWFAENPFSNQQASYRKNDLDRLINGSLYDHRLLPFFTPKKDFERIFTFTNRMNLPESGFEWQLGQAGLSVHLFLDENLGSKQPKLLIGAPGVRQWSGAVVLYTNENESVEKMGRLNRNPKDPTFSHFVVLNRGIIPEKGNDVKDVFWDEYFGYSVSSGKYLNKTEVLYTAGAPRADYCGSVIIFRASPYNPPAETYKRQISPVLNITAPPNSYASYFGSVIYSVDLDEDGLDELVVGAPLYTFDTNDYPSTLKEGMSETTISGNDETIESNSNEDGDQGSVFIYKFNSKAGAEAPIQRLVGSKSPQARFGYAITSIQFKFNEMSEIYLVVGAPFEASGIEDGTASGAIYLYLYNKALGKFEEYSQRITASQISTSINGFGSSFSMPVDVDNNNTPDLAIGAFKSGHAVVLRTRPEISLNGELTVLSSSQTSVQKILRGTKKFYLRSCVRVRASMGFIDDKFEIWTRLRFADPTIRFHEKHVHAHRDNTDNAITLYTKDVLAGGIDPTCTNITLLAINRYGVGMNDSDQILEMVHPFTFVQEVWYNDSLTNGIFLLKMHAQQARPSISRTTQGISFSSFRSKVPNTQTSTLSLSVPISLSDCKADPCQPNLVMTWSFFHPLAENTSMQSFLLGSAPEFFIKLLIVNTGETAEKLTLALDWNSVDISESKEGERWLYKSCIEDLAATTSKIFHGCRLASYILTGRQKSIFIRLSTDSVFAKAPASFNFIINAQVNFGDDRINVARSRGQLQIQFPTTQAKIIGSIGNEVLRGNVISYNVKESTIKANKESVLLYEPFRQTFTVRVLGVSVSEAVTHFKIPVAWNSLVDKPKQIFFLKQPDTMNMPNIKCELTSSSRFSFHSIDKINGSLPSIPNNTPAVEIETVPHEHKYLISEPSIVRRRRETNDSSVNSTQTTVQQEEQPQIAQDTHIFHMTMNKQKKPAPEGALKFMCLSENDCLAFKCTIKKLQANSVYHIPFELYPVKDAIDDLLKTTKSNVLFITTNGSVDIFPMSLERKHYHDSDVANVVLSQFANRPGALWVYLVAIGGGIFIMMCIAFGLYKCGFFKRQKREELNQMKAEHHRKSIMIAAARASMLVQSGTEDCESRENLTESEHQNEDSNVEPMEPEISELKTSPKLKNNENCE